MTRAPAVLKVVLGVGLALAAVACAKEKMEPLQLNGNRLIVRNDTDEEWKHVQIWLNWYYRMAVPSIAAHSRADATLDAFIEGYGRRFDFAHTQIKDLRLMGERPNGEKFELTKHFDGDSLNDALGGKK